MVKNVLIALSILLSIALMFFISLSNGIRLGNFSYENVSIEGLYLKYDEKIIIDTQSVSVFSQHNPNKKLAQFKLKFSVESFFDNYFIRVYNFSLFEPYLKVTGDILLNPNKIDLENISDLYFNNFSIQFSKNLSPVTAEKCFVEYKKESFYFTFENPQYRSVDISNSKVSIIEYKYVDIDINSKDKLNSDALELLSNYRVNIPVKQLSGTNNTHVGIKIPFDIKKDMDIRSSIVLADGKILLYGIPLYTQSLQLELNNRYLDGTGKLFQNKNNLQNLYYDIDTDFQIDFKTQKVDGKFELHNAQFEKLKTNDTNGTFQLDFEDNFQANVILKEDTDLIIANQPFVLEKVSTHYTNTDQTFKTTLQAKHKQYNLSFDIKDQFALDSLKSKGSAKLNLDHNNTILKNELINYQSSFKQPFTLDFNTKDINLTYKQNNLSSEYLEGKYHSKNNTINLQSPALHIDSLELPFGFNDVKLKVQPDQVSFSTKIDKSHTVKGELDIETGKIKGTLVKPDINLDFQGDIYSPKNITAPKIGLQYKEYKDKSYTLQITDPRILQEYFDFLIMDEHSFIEAFKKPQNETFDVKMKNIDFDLFKRQDTEDKKAYNKNNILANINWTKSSIILGKYKIPFKQANINLSKDISHTNLLGIDDTNVNIKKDKHELVITSSNIGSDFVNKVFEENYIENGHFELFLSNRTKNTYEGVVKIDSVTFKDLRFIDNLLLFVNTTPALINPLLAIPTFLRFGANGFKVNGYYASEGEFRFVYHKETQILELFSIKTIGNINNFQGNLTLDLSSDTISGNLDVIFLKDFATVLNTIPLVNKVLLNKDGHIAIPVEISGTLEDTKFEIKGKD